MNKNYKSRRINYSFLIIHFFQHQYSKMEQQKVLVGVAIVSAATSAVVSWCSQSECDDCDENDKRQLERYVENSWAATNRSRRAQWWEVRELFDVISQFLLPQDLASASGVRGAWLGGVIHTLGSYEKVAHGLKEVGKRRARKHAYRPRRRYAVRAETFDAYVAAQTSKVETIRETKEHSIRHNALALNDEHIRAKDTVSGLSETFHLWCTRQQAARAWQAACVQRSQ